MLKMYHCFPTRQKYDISKHKKIMKNKNQLRNIPGFTLVELLIVIAIIAILAAITFVTFKGVQERAYNSRVIEGVRQYADAIKSYKAIYRTYPKTAGELNGDWIAMTCLGKDYPGNTCGKVSNTSIYIENSFYTEISKVLKNTNNSINDRTYRVGGEDYMGAVYGIDTVGGSAQADTYKGSDGRGRVIEYVLIGSDADCVLPGAWSYNRSTTPATTACEIGLEPFNP